MLILDLIIYTEESCYFYVVFMLTSPVFNMFLYFLITQIYQIPWSSEVIHQEHWKADLYWILLSDLI